MSLAAKLGRLLLAAALLAGWQAALEHPVRHVDEHGGFVHGSHDSGGAAELACDAIAAVAAVIGGASSLALPATFAVHAVPAYLGNSASVAPLLAYRSQAPPQVS